MSVASTPENQLSRAGGYPGNSVFSKTAHPRRVHGEGMTNTDPAGITGAGPDSPGPAPAPMIISSEAARGGRVIRGSALVIGDWTADGAGGEVAPLHVHHADDEAWHVVSGALRFRFGHEYLIAAAGTTVLVPAGTAHTFGNAGPGPSRFIIIVPARLDELISQLHACDPAEHPEIYRRHESELLE
jgi:quercetin dioxygenase-like cupin family protein